MVFFAAEFYGSFTQANARQVFTQMVERHRQAGTTHFTGDTNKVRVYGTNSSGRHAIVGFYNLSTNQGGWLAVAGRRIEVYRVKTGPSWNPTWKPKFRDVPRNWMTNDGVLRTTGESWVSSTWNVRGYNFKLRAGMDGNADAHLVAEGPF